MATNRDQEPQSLYHLQSLGWKCPQCGAPPVRTIPAKPTPRQVLTCTIVCSKGHETLGEDAKPTAAQAAALREIANAQEVRYRGPRRAMFDRMLDAGWIAKNWRDGRGCIVATLTDKGRAALAAADARRAP